MQRLLNRPVFDGTIARSPCIIVHGMLGIHYKFHLYYYLKGITGMDWLQRMNNAISYIEDNLVNDIDYNEAAKAACCSAYHFQRMFSFITNIPLSEYIRRRRLTLAAFALQNSNAKVIDIALQYGYESPEAFARAFQNLHGVTPTSARNVGVQLKAYSRISFHIIIKGDVEMNYRIEDAKAFKMFGISTEITNLEDKAYDDTKEFVDQCIQNGTAQSILDEIGYGPLESIGNGPLNDNGIRPVGLFALYGFNKNSHSVMIGADYPSNKVSDKFEVLDMPAATFAVFSIKASKNEGNDTIANIWKRLGEWFLTSGYENAPDVPELEKRFRTKEGYVAEVWIPVVKK